MDVNQEKQDISPISRDNYSAIRELFKQHYTPLVLFAKNYIPDVEIDKDIVQEVFLTLIEAGEGFNSIDNFKAYLYQSVKNKCLKHLRHEEVKKRYFSYARQEMRHDEFFLEHILEEEVYSLLIREIENLPEQCRKVYLLSLEGKSNQEIADKLSIGIETVKSHKKAGKQFLYNRLKDILPLGILVLFLR